MDEKALLLALGILAMWGCATPSEQASGIEAQGIAAPVAVSGELPVVLTLQAETATNRDPLALLETLSRHSAMARIATMRGNDETEVADVNFALVFPSRAEFNRWYAAEGKNFLAQLGSDAKIKQAALKDLSLLETAGLNDTAKIAEHFSVVYENAGSTEDGDADIDAVTTICADGAICKPSN